MEACNLERKTVIQFSILWVTSEVIAAITHDGMIQQLNLSLNVLFNFSYFIYSLYTSSGFSYFPITSLYYKMGQNCCSNTLHCTDAKEFNYNQPPFRKSTTKEYFSNYYSGFSTASVNNSSITEFDIRELNSNSLDSETTSFYSGINTQKNNSDIFTTEFILGFDDIDFDEIPNEKNQSKNLTHRY